MTLVNRMLERAPETVEDLLPEEMVIWSDNSNEETWYYLAVQEATNSHIPERKEGHTVPGLSFEYESWVEIIENPDWAQLEKDLIKAMSKSNSELSFIPAEHLQTPLHYGLQRSIPLPLKQYQAAWQIQTLPVK
jgi:hypothetical protein